MQLADEGGSAFVSQSLRPFVIAALADRDVRRPTVVVAGDDRSARDLAQDLRAWLRPRAVRYYPSRGVAYESHLTPPPHLVGLRVAALDALTDTPAGSEQPVVIVSAVALSEKVPDPELRPHGFTLRKGDLLDLDEAANDLVAAGYQRVDQVEERGQFAVRGGLLDIYPPPRSAPSASTCSTSRSTRCGGSPPSRSAASARPTRSRSRPPPSWRPSTASWPRSRRARRSGPDIAELLPVDRFRELLDLIPESAQIVIAADEDVEPSLRDHWADVCVAFHDDDAHHLYVKPDRILQTLRRPCGDPALLDQRRPADRDPRPVRRLRRPQPQGGRGRAGEAHALRLHDRRRLAAARRRRARRLQPRAPEGRPQRRLHRPDLHRGQPARRLRRARPQARRLPRAPADPPPQGQHAADAQGPRPAALLHRPADRRHRRPRGPRHRALRRLRHQDRRRRHARLPQPRVPGRRQGLPARRPAREDLALRRRRRLAPAAEQARRHPLGPHEGARPPRRAGAGRRAAQPLRRAQAPPRPRRSRSSPTSCASWRPPSRTARRPTSATPSTP